METPPLMRQPIPARRRPAKPRIVAGLASVIVVNWNGAELLAECLDSLLAQTYQPLEIVVVDNGSTDDSIPLLRRQYGERIKMVELDENKGFAGGNNAGLRVALGEFILLLNNDAVADARWVEALVAAAQRDPAIGGCTSKIMLYDHRDLFENTGLMLYPDGSARGRGRLQRDVGQFAESDEVACPSGCACLYRRAAIEQAGAFDPTFFCYCDDVELGLKCRVLGWHFVYAPEAVAWHKGSVTGGRYSRFKAFMVERNRLWVMFKTYPVLAIVLSPWHTALRYGWNLSGSLRGRGATGQFVKQDGALALAGVLLKAYGAALVQLPRILRERLRLCRRGARVKRPGGPGRLWPWLRGRALSAREFTQVE